jgi:hypothetical protein
MTFEVSRYRAPTDVERRYAAELDASYHRAEVSEAEVAGVAQVTKRATVEAMGVNLLRRTAAQAAPDGAELYAMLTVAGVSEMASVIASMRRLR